MVKNVLTIQRKELVDYFESNSLYVCKQTRENSYKYRKMQDELNLGNYFPIWVFSPFTSCTTQTDGEEYESEEICEIEYSRQVSNLSKYEYFKNDFMYSELIRLDYSAFELISKEVKSW